MRKMHNSKSQRVDTISGIARMNLPDNWQNVDTPYKIVREMLGLIPESDIYVVFFSMEFLEVMIHEKNIPRDKIVFVADTKVEQTYASCREWYNVKSVLYPKQIVTKDSIVNTLKDVDMKFKKIAVVGNPPYQMADGGNARSAKPIYHLFVEAIIDGITPDNFSMIIPSRWMVGGKGLDSFRDRMINDNHMKKIVDDMSCNGVFDSVDISGGVNYFLWSKNHNGPCDFNGVERFLNEEDIVIRENSARSILTKIKNKADRYVGMVASASKPYGLRADATITESGVMCWFKQSIGKKFVDQETIKDARNDIHKWKVLAPRAPIAGQTDFTKPIGFFNDNNIIIAEPNEICTETYIVVNSFDTETEATNFSSYMKTKLFRFMLRMRVISQDVTRENYNWVPDMEDYTKEYTDEYLYKTFGLNKEEIAYIESKIKEI